MIVLEEPYIPMPLQAFCKHYGTYDVVTDRGKTGIKEVSSGTIETQLNVFLDILSEIEDSLQVTEKNISNKIISSIKNIISDRHIVQKNINSVFQNYRASIPPNVAKYWDAMNEDIQSNFIKFKVLWPLFLSWSC